MFPLMIRPAGFGVVQGGISTYYPVLQALTPVTLLKLEDATTDARGINGAIVGTYAGTYLQSQASLLGDSSARSVRFNSGHVLLNQSQSAPQVFTIVCRFKAIASASGTLFSFDSRVGGEFDRVVHFNSSGQVNFYGYTDQEVNVATPASYRDNLAHTLVVRVTAGTNIAIFIDGVQVVSSSIATLAAYTGFWNIGGVDIYGRRPRANGIQISGFAIFNRALTNAEITSIHQSVGGSSPASSLSYTASQSSIYSNQLTGTFANLTNREYTSGVGTNSAAEEWVKATFAAPTQVSSVVVAGGEIDGWGGVAAYLNGAVIQYSADDAVWTTIATIAGVTNSGADIEKAFAFSPTTARYWRVRRVGGYLSTTELRFA